MPRQRCIAHNIRNAHDRMPNWTRLRASNVIERAFREVRRTHVIGRFPGEMAGLA